MDPMFGRSYSAFLFDMDGTLLTSIASAERSWAQWAERHGLDVASFLPTIHGVRSVDTIRNLGLPGVDPEAEAAEITRAEIADVADVRPINGAASFLQAIPADRWALVTSAPRALAEARFRAAGLPGPHLMVSAEDVQTGKPAPDGYILAAQRLGFDVAECLVFEDAVAGIRAGEAAGADVLVITQTHSSASAAHGQPSVRDYVGIGIRVGQAGLAIVQQASQT